MFYSSLLKLRIPANAELHFECDIVADIKKRVELRFYHDPSNSKSYVRAYGQGYFEYTWPAHSESYVSSLAQSSENTLKAPKSISERQNSLHES